MFKEIWIRLIRGEDRRNRVSRDWRTDPLSHPSIERMSEREIADLPMASARGLAVSRQCAC